MKLRDKLYGLSTEVNRRITFHSCLIGPAGGPLEALILSQAIFWQGVVGKTGWFYKTQKKWEEETGLTRSRQETCRKKLIAQGLLRERRGGKDNKLFFQVVNDKVEAIIAAGVQETCTPSSETTYEANDRSVCGKPADRCAGFLHSKNSTQEEDLRETLVVETPLPSATTSPRTTWTKSKEEEGQETEEAKTKTWKKVSGKKKTSTLPAPLPFDVPTTPRTKLVKATEPGFGGDGGPPKGMGLPDFAWPPEKGRDVYWFWAHEVQVAFPGFTPPFPGRGAPKVYKQCKTLLTRAGSPETCAATIRVAIWDWKAVQESIEVWKTKDLAVPDIGMILYLQTQLAAKLKSGVVGATIRVSRYKTKFIDKPAVAAPEHNDGLTGAQRHQKKLAARRAAKKAEAQAG